VTDRRLILLTLAALAAFAANSILCRLALGHELIDPMSYTVIRLVSGSMMLALLARAWHGSWRAGLMLFLYAAPFSLAYVELTAGTGALIAFSAVQFTMIAASIVGGRHPVRGEWAGMLLAMIGLYVLVKPGLAAPSLVGALLMATAGVGWGFYSLIGRGSKDPLRDTAGNFARAALLSIILGMAARSLPGASSHWTTAGITLAVASGAITSALGYVLWYAALRHLAATRAALVQTSVPALSALGGILLLGEPVAPRLLIASLLILGGIVLAIWSEARKELY